jgi:hypothetical protein
MATSGAGSVRPGLPRSLTDDEMALYNFVLQIESGRVEQESLPLEFASGEISYQTEASNQGLGSQVSM